MIVERIRHSGALVISDFVRRKDGTVGPPGEPVEWLETLTFYDYDENEAREAFKEYLREKGLVTADMNDTITPKVKYTFGSAGNSYFNGSDGLVTRDDGKTIKINMYDDQMAVDVKASSFDILDGLPEDVKRKAQEVIHAENFRNEVDVKYADFYEREYSNILYERLRESWWHDAEWMAQDHDFDGVHSAGRSGGWCVVEGSRWIAENFPSQPKPKDYKTPCYFCGEPEDDEQEHGDGGHMFDGESDPYEQRDRFLALAFDLVAHIDGIKEQVLVPMIEEEYAELEARREANIVRGEE